MSQGRYRVVFTDGAREALRELDGAEDDRTGLLGALAVTCMVSPATHPPVITATTIRTPKGT